MLLMIQLALTSLTVTVFRGVRTQSYHALSVSYLLIQLAARDRPKKKITHSPALQIQHKIPLYKYL